MLQFKVCDAPSQQLHHSIPSGTRKGIMNGLVATEDAVYSISQKREVVFRRLAGGDPSWYVAQGVTAIINQVGRENNYNFLMYDL